MTYRLDCARDHIRTGRSEHPLNCTGVGASLMTLSSHNPSLLAVSNFGERHGLVGGVMSYRL